MELNGNQNLVVIGGRFEERVKFVRLETKIVSTRLGDRKPDNIRAPVGSSHGKRPLFVTGVCLDVLWFEGVVRRNVECIHPGTKRCSGPQVRDRPNDGHAWIGRSRTWGPEQ